MGLLRLEFNSPAVPGWNEVDAVGIGRCSCPPGATVDAPMAASVAAAGRIEWARPNPFTTATDIGFTLPRQGRTRVEVFSVSGQRVTTLVDGLMPPGRHEAGWDGRDNAGRVVPSGVYYVRLETEGVRSSRKIVKLR